MCDLCTKLYLNCHTIELTNKHYFTLNCTNKMVFNSDSESEFYGTYTIHCRYVRRPVVFKSIRHSDELYDLTAISKYFNNDVDVWINNNLDIIFNIDKPYRSANKKYKSLSDVSSDTLTRCDDCWYGNIIVLIEYLRSIDISIMSSFITSLIDNMIDNVEY